MRRFIAAATLVVAVFGGFLYLVPTPSAFAGGAGPVTVKLEAHVLHDQLTCPTVPTECSAPTSGDFATLVAINHVGQFGQIDSVKITLIFSTDAVDPGEQLALGHGEGFENVTTAPIIRRIITLTAAAQPDDVQLFENTLTTALPVWMVNGSAHLRHVCVTITGTPAGPVG